MHVCIFIMCAGVRTNACLCMSRSPLQPSRAILSVGSMACYDFQGEDGPYATDIPRNRYRCQCRCGCRRMPGSRRLVCPSCGHYVGPGCCWVLIDPDNDWDSGHCHMCAPPPPEPEPEPRSLAYELWTFGGGTIFCSMRRWRRTMMASIRSMAG